MTQTQNKGKTCLNDECEEPAHCRGMCVRHYSKWRYDNGRPGRLAWERWSHLRRRYGIERETYEMILKVQQGRCRICRTDKPGGRGNVFHVDHDHACCPTAYRTCGACVRGLLCYSCNSGLGSFRDSQAVMEVAVEYLNNWKYLRNANPTA